MLLLLLALLYCGSASAQFLEISIKLGGLACASCSKSVEKTLKRIKGVEEASYNEQASSADVKLAEVNHVSLNQVRDALKGLGYTPEVALFRARGRIRRGDKSALFFEVEGTDAVFNAVPVKEIGFSGKLIEVTGTISPPRPPAEGSMLIYTIKHLESDGEEGGAKK